MSVLIEDRPRNLLAWIVEAIQQGLAAGAVITPFATPPSKRPQRRTAQAMVTRLREMHADAWFDPTTHALQMPNVCDFRYYSDYDLWGGSVGDLWTPAHRQDHVRRVFAVQDVLGVT